jgi:hypothetical protein
VRRARSPSSSRRSGSSCSPSCAPAATRSAGPWRCSTTSARRWRRSSWRPTSCTRRRPVWPTISSCSTSPSSATTTSPPSRRSSALPVDSEDATDERGPHDFDEDADDQFDEADEEFEDDYDEDADDELEEEFDEEFEDEFDDYDDLDDDELDDVAAAEANNRPANGTDAVGSDAERQLGVAPWWKKRAAG